MDPDKQEPPAGPIEDIDRPTKAAESAESAESPESTNDDGPTVGQGQATGNDSEDDDTDSDSMLEDALEALTQAAETDEPRSPDEVCTDEEGTLLRKELREEGPVVFCERNIDSGKHTAKKLLTAFGVRLPSFLEGQPDEAYERLLSVAIARELSRRIKLPQYNSVDDAVDLIKKSSNIILITGAGISTSLGIPDFRSKGTGLYSKLEHLGLADPQEVFDISLFREDPTIFYSIAKDIIPDIQNRYTPTHKFIAMLHQRGKLLTNYSQNIDNLETKAGVPKEKLIQCHGSFGTATCIQCHHKVDGETIFPDVRAGILPRCPKCIKTLRGAGGSMKRKQPAATTNKKKRNRWEDDDSDDDSEYDIPTAGVMKPDITFFGESLPDEFGKRLTEHDRDKVDLVIVIGTSLKVTPVSEVASWLPAHVPQIYVSREPVKHIEFDIDLLGDCDVVVAELCRRLDWPLVHEMVPEGQEVAVTSDETRKSRHVFVKKTDQGDEKKEVIDILSAVQKPGDLHGHGET